ncbi:MAG: hypothetical protein HYX21_00145 [Candidatus Yanofskybacteria bacterium]|nr:hypothetical protein [Candidatus Yanofskybacteria bacterium]
MENFDQKTAEMLMFLLPLTQITINDKLLTLFTVLYKGRKSMKSTAVETVLHMDDFTKYFETKRLGRLYFPNGRCYTHYELSQNDPFFIRLDDLYKLVTGWRVNHTLVPLGDIVAVIAFGSAVRHPKDIPYSRRKYFLFGPMVTGVYQEEIQPRDADFLIITGGNLMPESVLEPDLVHDNYGGAYVAKGGIHLVNRGISQLLNGVRANDTVSASALREGVPIFFNGRLDSVVTQAGVTKTTPRKIFWDENREGYLTGRIV